MEKVTSKSTAVSGAVISFEKKILVRFIAGSHSAFKAIIERYQKMVYHLAYRMVLHHDSANDLTQDTFLALWEKRRHYDPRFPPHLWLRRVVINKTLNFLARHEHRFKSDREDAIDHLEAPQIVNPERYVGTKETFELAHAAFAGLSADKRLTLALRLEGLSYAEIAEHLGCSIGTVMSRLSRAREDLRQHLSDKITSDIES